MDQTKIMLWYCRGAANKAFFRYCKQYVDANKPTMVVVMETRCNPTNLVKAFNNMGFDKHLVEENNGYVGGIVLAWEISFMTVELLSRNSQYIHTSISYPKGRPWLFTAIYASLSEDCRKTMWEELKFIASNNHQPWLVEGEFNDIASIKDKKGGAPVSLRRIKLFTDRVNACNLMDMGSHGPKYTWKGPIFHCGQQIYEKLDRGFCSDNWRLEFPDASVKVLDDKAFEVCLKETIENLKEWKEHSFKNVKIQNKEITARVKGIQCRLLCRNNDKALRKMEDKLQKELSDILEKDESTWFQRSRSKWLADEDRNTKYYHMKTVTRRRRNKEWMPTAINFLELTVEDYQGLIKDVDNEDSVSVPNQTRPWV
ncbi:uncharacterized protein LOC131649401 [Vicia villosa]|uniref:uncharacterized protein LOC131649401 n=1 Tax=Vicia villosa TaxID=3911 RepID=UPI00273BA0DA|nr:uncharacterized protein LOC131649401 [Vicia villosa]